MGHHPNYYEVFVRICEGALSANVLVTNKNSLEIKTESHVTNPSKYTTPIP